VDAVERGLVNLDKHLENIALFGVPVIVALNHFTGDSSEEIDRVEQFCLSKGVPMAVIDVWQEGGEGGIELAGKLVDLLHNTPSKFHFLYDLDLPLKEKIDRIAKQLYGAARVVYSVEAEHDIKLCKKQCLDHLPICMAKTQYSLSDDATLLGKPEGFKISVREIRFSAGAGFLVPMTGKITTMPGLPATPMSEMIDIDLAENIVGLE